MDLEKERELNYKINIVRDEQEFQLLIVEFEAVVRRLSLKKLIIKDSY